MMHADQLEVPVETVRALVAEQFPELVGETVRSIASDATVNAIFRIGDRLAARFPLRLADVTEQQLADEERRLERFADACPFPAPRPVAIGRPGGRYPLPWPIRTWLPGAVATPTGLAASTAFADELAVLIRALRSVDTGGATFAGDGRGGDLRDSDGWMATCFRESCGLLDVDALERAWGRFRALPAGGPDVMSHGDLIPPNLLVDGTRLAGVLDGGGFGPADPALDLVSAWHLLDRPARERLRESIGCGRTEWARGAAWAFEQAMGLVWYYRESNPGMSALGRSTLARVLHDPDL